jgi:hypothetical protein
MHFALCHARVSRHSRLDTLLKSVTANCLLRSEYPQNARASENVLRFVGLEKRLCKLTLPCWQRTTSSLQVRLVRSASNQVVG